MRAIPQSACSDVESPDNVRAVIHYGSSTATPNTSAWEQDDSCDDEDSSNLIPYLHKTVSAAAFSEITTATVGINSDNLFRWYLNDSSMMVGWDTPTLFQLTNDGEATFETDDNLIEIDASADGDDWVYLIIETTFAVPHPIHLHGFDFFVLAQGTGTYDEADVALQTDNPPRRDTAMLPASGYLVMGFPADNPGAWIMHCHIGWHTSMGFDLQFLVRRDDLLTDVLVDDDVSMIQDTCTAWSNYANVFGIEQHDSGV